MDAQKQNRIRFCIKCFYVKVGLTQEGIIILPSILSSTELAAHCNQEL